MSDRIDAITEQRAAASLKRCCCDAQFCDADSVAVEVVVTSSSVISVAGCHLGSTRVMSSSGWAVCMQCAKKWRQGNLYV